MPLNSVRTTAAWNPFPLELWRLIFMFLRGDGEEHVVSALTIHPALVEQAELALYRDIRITNLSRAFKLKVAFSTSVPRRAQAVRSILLLIPWMHQPHSYNCLQLVGEMLEKLTGLVTLEVEATDISHPYRPPLLPMLVAGRKLSVKRLQGGLLRLHSKFVEFLRANPQLEEVHLVDPEWPRRPGAPEPVLFESLELPNLHTLACNHLIMAPIKNPRNITRLHVVEDDSDWDVIRDVVRIFGAQLISLRVDFYHSLGVLPKSNYHYPTLREYRWEGCPRLKFLHIDDKPLPLILGDPSQGSGENGKYGVDERKKAKLPPALETLIWGPLRTRYDDRSAIQQFGEAVLRDMAHVREVIYMWSPKEDYFHCSLSTADELRERRTDRREADRMWAEV